MALLLGDRLDHFRKLAAEATPIVPLWIVGNDYNWLENVLQKLCAIQREEPLVGGFACDR